MNIKIYLCQIMARNNGYDCEIIQLGHGILIHSHAMYCNNVLFYTKTWLKCQLIFLNNQNWIISAIAEGKSELK